MWDFGDLVNIEEFWEKRETFNPERGEVSFYCKDCEKLVDATREKPKKYVFTCPECNSQNIAIWTLSGLKDNYKIK